MKLFEKFGGDKALWVIAIFLAVFSMIVIYSAASTLADPLEKQDFKFYLSSHGFNLVLGFFMLCVVQMIDFRWFSKLSKIGIVIGVILLVATVIWGDESNEAKRGLFGFQTFNIIQLTVIVFLAHVITKWGDEINDIKHKFLPLLGFIVAMVVLILSQNFSTGFILMVACFVMLFISPLKKKTFFLTIIFLFIFVVIFVWTDAFGIEKLSNRTYTVKNRVERFFETKDSDIKETIKNINPDDIHQDILAEGAVATGGILLKKGPGNSIYQKLPQRYSDYIFALVVEEYGAIVGAIIIVIYLILFYRAVSISKRSQSVFGSYLAMGVGFLISFQAMIHIAVNLGAMPSTGQPLPLFSWGGISILVSSISLGILINISKHTTKKKTKNKVLVEYEENNGNG